MAEVVCFSVGVRTTWPSEAQNLPRGGNPLGTVCLLSFNLVLLNLKPCLQQAIKGLGQSRACARLTFRDRSVIL